MMIALDHRSNEAIFTLLHCHLKIEKKNGYSRSLRQENGIKGYFILSVIQNHALCSSLQIRNPIVRN